MQLYILGENDSGSLVNENDGKWSKGMTKKQAYGALIVDFTIVEKACRSFTVTNTSVSFALTTIDAIVSIEKAPDRWKLDSRRESYLLTYSNWAIWQKTDTRF